MNPKVSIIMPVYNSEKYLKQCLDTVVNQTLKDIEIICVDDGSTDNSLKILLEYKKRDCRICIVSQENQHAGVARNNGLKLAKGEYLSFLDSDDLFDSNMLEEMYKKAKEDDSDVVVCGFYVYDSEKNTCGKRVGIKPEYCSESPFSPIRFQNELFFIASLNPWTKLFRRKMFVEKNIQFSNSICCNDLSGVCTALACSNKISIIDKPFIKYRLIQSSNLSANRSKHTDSFLIAVNDLENNLKRLNLYKLFKNTFIDRIKSSFNWEMSPCNNKQKEQCKQIAKKILSDDLYYVLYNERK